MSDLRVMGNDCWWAPGSLVCDRVADLMGFSRSAVSLITSQYTMASNTSADRTRCSWKSQLGAGERRALHWIVDKRHKTTAPQITAEFKGIGISENRQVCTVHRWCPWQSCNSQTFVDTTKCPQTPQNMDTGDIELCDMVWWVNFYCFPTYCHVYVWRSPEEAYSVDCLKPTVQHGGGSSMAWGAISWNSLGLINVLKGKVIAQKYLDILSDRLNPMVQTLFPDGDAIFQNNNAPIHIARCIGS